jgi:hypothetical protein
MVNPEKLEDAGAAVESRGDACWSSDWADWSGHPECDLLAPVWLQIVHLLVAELFWVLVVLASANLLFATVDRSSDARTVVDSKAAPSMALRSDFVVKS